jgi:hypothetical protein
MLRATTRWVLLPVLYAVTVPVLFVASMLPVALLLERPAGFVWAAAVVVASIAACALVLVLVSVGFARLEARELPGLSDHLRHCALLYAGMLALAAYLIYEELKPWPCCPLQWSMAALLLLIAGFAAALNASTIYLVRRRQLARLRRYTWEP